MITNVTARIANRIQKPASGAGFFRGGYKMEDGDTENYHVSSVIQNFVFLCRKVGSIKGYLL